MNRSITLSAGEWRIMERLWERSPRTLTELVRELGPETGWSKSTIVTMVGRLEGNFIEGMACEGGCVQGAGCLVRSPKNKLDVEKHAKEAKDRGVVQAVSTAKGVEAPKPAPAKAAAKAEGAVGKA